MKKCEMFCYQCQETARGTGCTKVGVCGKRPELSSMLDLLIYVTKGLSCVTTKLREEGKEIGKDVNHLVTVNRLLRLPTRTSIATQSLRESRKRSKSRKTCARS